jgi:hypothetical protein
MMYPIEDAVPVPDIVRERVVFKYPFAKMLVGQSFAVPLGDEEADRVEQRLRTATYRYTKQEGGTVKFTVRALDNEVRVWRTA